jgi:hypothetical protein
MERNFEIDDEVYFTCFRVFVAGVAQMVAARLLKTSKSIILRRLFVFFFRQRKWELPIIYIFFAMCLYNIKKKLIFVE